MLQVSLVTLGDPGTMTGGYLYHQRIASAASRHDANVRFVSFPDRRFPLPAKYAARVMREAEAGDVCLLDSICAAYAAPRLLAAAPAIPLVAILHQPPGGIDHAPARAWVQRRLDLFTYGRCAALLLASAALRDDLPERCTRGRRVVVVPPGTDAGAPNARGAHNLRAGRKAAVLCVGNWVERKDILALLDAFAALPPTAATLHLVGDPWAAPAYGRRVWARLAELGLLERAVVHGAVSEPRLAELYRGADLFVLPSLREPYGTVYGEAMAAGLPVVGWRAGNLPHLATDGVEGAMLPAGDVRGLSAALLRLCEDGDLRRHMASAARRRARSFPTWEQTAADLFTTLAELAGT
jgi:glycosyltransferase involved in cell wall biosynthesis